MYIVKRTRKAARARAVHRIEKTRRRPLLIGAGVTLVTITVLPSRTDVMITGGSVAIGTAEATALCVGVGEMELQLVVSISFAFCAMHFSLFRRIRNATGTSLHQKQQVLCSSSKLAEPSVGFAHEVHLVVSIWWWSFGLF